jgi:beta-glucosidase
MRILAKCLTLCLLFLCNYLSLGQTQGQDTNAQIERRVDNILAKMTLENKIRLIGGYDDMLVHAIPSVGFPQLRTADGPEGVRTWGPETAYAAGIALAATWNPDMARRLGESMGSDARAEGVHILLAPGVNIVRAPMDGRDFEYFGEDPFLASRIAVPFIQGVQSKGVVATVKHFAANNLEYGRSYVSSDMDERTLREIYLPAFEAAVKEAHVGSVMSALNLVNGEYAAENRHLNVDILKGEWGFDGILMSDWGAVHNGVASANAGLDLEMASGQFMSLETLLPAIESGKVSESTIDDKVRRIIRTAVRFGFLDREQLDVNIPLFNRAANKIALDSARESITLLKNEGHVLPLDRAKIKTIAVIGPNAWPAFPGGGGSSQVLPFAPVSILQGIADATDAKVLYARGLSADAAGLPLENDVYAKTVYGNALERAATNDVWGGPETVKIEAYTDKDFSGTPKILHSRRIDAAHLHTPIVVGGSIRYTASFTPIFSESHLFLISVQAEDSYKLWVNGEQVLEKKAGYDSQSTNWIELPLERDKTASIRIDYVPSQGHPQISLGVLPESQLVSEEAKRIAKQADAVIVSVGFDPSVECEGHERPFALPWGQDRLIQTISALNKRTIVTLTSGGNVDMRPWLDRVPALVHTWYPGQQGGTALAEIIFGDRSPEGHLPVTFDRSWEDSPVHNSYYAPLTKQGEIPRVTYSEGVFVGYRYYTSKNITPQFPFGFGLSYTNFSFTHLVVTPATSKVDDYSVDFDVTNIGKVSGSDVAQLYVGDPSSAVIRPEKELKGFDKVRLEPGQTKHISIKLDSRSFAYWDVIHSAWHVDPGRFTIYVGDSSENTPLKTDIVLKR